ncbi:MAG: hypothetical protein ABIS51_19790 [Sphingomonas sp.]
MRICLTIFALAGAVAAQPAAASADFQACDGYEIPSAKSDGMTTTGLLWGLARGNADIRKGATTIVASEGVLFCDQALADPLLLPAYQLRRAHLLQAKAVHQIAGRDPAGALQSLEQSDAIGKVIGTAAFANSVALGNHEVRAFALAALGRKLEAIAETEALAAARPWSPSTQRLAFAIRMKIDPDLDGQLKGMKAGAPIDPAMLGNIFWIAMGAGKFDIAASVGGQIDFEMPGTRGNWTIANEDTRKYRIIVDRAGQAGAWAYSLATTGQGPAGEAAIASARRIANEAMAPPPMPESGKLSKSAARDLALRQDAGLRALDLLDKWEWAVRFREQIAQKTPDDLMAGLKAFGPAQGDNPTPRDIVSDMLGHLPAPTPAAVAQRDAIVAAFYQRFDTARRHGLEMSTADLEKALPRPETPAMQPNFKHAGDGYFLSDNGFSQRRLDDPEIRTVRFTHGLASAATVEELALLSAATLAQREGKDGLLILSRRNLERTTTMVGYYSNGAEIPSGREASMNVVFVKIGALPERYKGYDWRVLNVATIIADLAPRFVAAQ